MQKQRRQRGIFRETRIFFGRANPRRKTSRNKVYSADSCVFIAGHFRGDPPVILEPNDSGRRRFVSAFSLSATVETRSRSFFVAFARLLARFSLRLSSCVASRRVVGVRDGNKMTRTTRLGRIVARSAICDRNFIFACLNALTIVTS